MYKTESFDPNVFKPAHFESDHEITLHGVKVPYHTVSEDNVFYNDDGRPIASIFSYSYFRSDVADVSDRPVIFGFNGGPGSSSTEVHTGFLGPRRLYYGNTPDRPTAFGPYQVIDNQDCLLDIADLVLIDPVGTGYGVLIDENEIKQFYGIEEDAQALLAFIEKWVRQYGRGLSPKYIVGESYGCTRTAIAVGMAATQTEERHYGIAFDGVVLIGNTVTVGGYFGENMPVEPAVLGFPSYAAVNWYHCHPSDKPLEEFVAEARNFADSEYLVALMKGESLTEAEKKPLMEKIIYYTGVSKEYLEYHGMKIEDSSFRTELLKKQGKAVARFDGRMTRPLHYPLAEEARKGEEDDAEYDRWTPYFYAVLTGDVLPRLNVKLSRNYITSANVWRFWNYKMPLGNTADQLENAMSRQPGMRTFFANGWFDLCTETGYLWHTLNHAGLPKDRTFFKGYPSGHMIYIGEENVKNLCEDVRKFIQGKDPTK